MGKKFLKSKLLIVLFGMFVLFIMHGKDVNAASASISASNKSVSVGDNVSINVSINAMAWNVKVSGSGVSGSIVGGNMESMSNKSTSKSYTLDTSKAGSYTVSISGDVTDANGNNSNVSDSVTVKVSEKSSTNSSTNKTNTNTTTNNNTSNSNTTKEPTFKSSNDTMYATGDINVRKSYSTDSDIIGKLATGDSISRTGIGDNGWSKVSYNGSTGYIKTSLLSDKEPEKSSDKALKTLITTPEGLDPEFNPEVTNYTLTVDKDVEKVDIKAAPNDEKAKVEITGNEDLQPGDNMIKITVTAQDETTRTYTINVKKQESDTLGLATLSVSGYSLSPKFTSSNYEYKLNVLDPNVTKLDITATANDENATVQISGNTDLKDGDNKVQIIVTSQDETEKVIYQISVNKTPMVAGTTKNDNGNIIYIGIIVAILAIFVVAVIIMKKRKSMKYESEEQEDEFDDLYGYSSKKNRSMSNESVNLENSNNVVDHELFGELPEEKYAESRSNVYSKISNYSENRTNMDYASSINENEYTKPYNDVYKTINENNSNELYETSNIQSKYGNIYNDTIDQNPSYTNIYGSNNIQEPSYKTTTLDGEYSNLYNSSVSSKSTYESSSYNNIDENSSYSNLYGNDTTYKSTYTDNSVSSYNNDVYGTIKNQSKFGNSDTRSVYNNLYGTDNTQSEYKNIYQNNNNSSTYENTWKDQSYSSNLYENSNIQSINEDNYGQVSTETSSYNSQYGNNVQTSENDIDDDDYTLDDNYKMKRTKGKHSI